MNYCSFPWLIELGRRLDRYSHIRKKGAMRIYLCSASINLTKSGPGTTSSYN